jgi:hypothetical protein
LPPIGVSSGSATAAPTPYSSSPQRSARCSRGSSTMHSTANTGIGRNALNGNGAQPPSGKAQDRKAGGMKAAAAMPIPS